MRTLNENKSDAEPFVEYSRIIIEEGGSSGRDDIDTCNCSSMGC
jgi:hypothetical protein